MAGPSPRSSLLGRLALATAALVVYLAPIAHAGTAQCFQSRALCISASPNGTNVQFVLSFTTPGWVAFGLSPSKTMANADVAMVWLQSTTKGNAAMVSDRFLSGHSSARADAQQDWNVVSATSSGARQIVTLQRAIDTKDQADYPFENKTQSFIWAFGMDPVQPTDQSPNFIPHSGANHGAFDYNALIPDPPAPAGNGTSADPAAGGSAVDAPPSPGRVLSDNTAVYIHAICMASAWGFLAYMGAFVARFLKTRLGKWWFPAHWGIMAMVAVLSIAGTVAMYLGRGFVALDSVHGIAGSVVLVVMLLQIILGIVIDRMYDSGRTSIPGRDKAHWVIGYTLAIGGPASVLLGLLEYEASSALIGTYVATWILFILLFAYGMHQLPKKKIDPIRKSTLPREDEIHFQSVPRPGQPHAGLGRTPSLSARRPAPSHLASSGEILPRRVSAKAPPLSAPTASWMGGPPPAPMRDSDVPLGSPSASAVGSTASSYSRTPPRPRRPADLSLPRRSVVNIDGQDASDGSYAGPVPWSPGGNPTSPTRDFPPRSPRNASLGARAPLSPRSGRSGGVGAFESGTVRSDASLRVAPRRAPSSRRSSVNDGDDRQEQDLGVAPRSPLPVRAERSPRPPRPRPPPLGEQQQQSRNGSAFPPARSAPRSPAASSPAPYGGGNGSSPFDRSFPPPRSPRSPTGAVFPPAGRTVRSPSATSDGYDRRVRSPPNAERSPSSARSPSAGRGGGGVPVGMPPARSPRSPTGAVFPPAGRSVRSPSGGADSGREDFGDSQKKGYFDYVPAPYEHEQKTAWTPPSSRPPPRDDDRYGGGGGY